MPGRASFAGGSEAAGGGPFDGDRHLRGQVLYDDAPYGVGYLVTLLTAPRPSPTLLPPRDPGP